MSTKQNNCKESEKTTYILIYLMYYRILRNEVAYTKTILIMFHFNHLITCRLKSNTNYSIIWQKSNKTKMVGL